MGEPNTRFEAALTLAQAVEANQRAAVYFKRRLDGIADAANTLGLDALSKTLFGLAQEIAAQGNHVTAIHKAAHKALIGAAMEPQP